MKVNRFLIAITALFVFSAAGIAQTAPAAPAKPSQAKLPAVSEILANYVKAIGGREANMKIDRRVAKGTVEMMPMGLKGTFESVASVPNKTYTKMTVAGIGDLVEGFDGTTSWSVNPIQGAREKSGNELVQTKLISTFHRDIELEKHYSNWEVKGVEKVGTSDAYVVVGTPKGLSPETFYFDTKSGLLLRSDSTLLSPEGNQNASTFYEDYKVVDGVNLPHRVRTKVPQMEIVMNISEMKHGGQDDPEIFKKPKQ